MRGVNHPSHYNSGNIEVIDFIEDKRFGFCLGNVIKYISRAGKKTSADKTEKEKELQDFKKAKWYLQREVFEITEHLPYLTIDPEEYIEDQKLDKDTGDTVRYLSKAMSCDDVFDVNLIIEYLEKAETALDKKIKKLESEILNQK